MEDGGLISTGIGTFSNEALDFIKITIGTIAAVAVAGLFLCGCLQGLGLMASYKNSSPVDELVDVRQLLGAFAILAAGHRQRFCGMPEQFNPNLLVVDLEPFVAKHLAAALAG